MIEPVAIRRVQRSVSKAPMGLSKRSVDCFKREAREQHTQYQRMIRRLLDAYIAHHQSRSAGRSANSAVGNIQKPDVSALPQHDNHLPQ